MEYLCSREDGTIADCILAAFVPFYPVSRRESLLYCR